MATDGERLYLRGLSTTGVAVAVTVQGDLKVQSTDMPCLNCHRRSGWGTVEGGVTIPPITGAAVFSPRTLGNVQMGLRTTGAGTRPAYDDATLLRVLRDGVDAGGRALSLTMPRYAVGAADVAALSSYLRSLSETPAAGVTPTTVHLATITSTGLDEAKRSALLTVLRAFVKAKNGGTRNEASRRDRGSWDMKSRNDTYRQWELHEWRLTGAAADWPAQLAEHYARQPVFAVVTGLAQGDWAPVHEFCERLRVPCVFPQTPAPPVERIDKDFYSTYFSTGLDVEAAALAHHLSAAGTRGTVLQVLRCGGLAESAARHVSRVLKQPAGRVRCLPPEVPLTASAWQGLLADGADVLVAWLEPADLARLGAIGDAASGGRVQRIYLSSSLVGETLDLVPAPLLPRVFLLEPFVPVTDLDRHAARALVWLKTQGIDTRYRRIAVNTLFAATIVGDALAIPNTLLSREYFVEQLEHMVGRTPMPSAYPALSLGPWRRLASLGSYVLQAPSSPGQPFTRAAPWFIPESHPQEDK